MSISRETGPYTVLCRYFAFTTTSHDRTNGASYCACAVGASPERQKYLIVVFFFFFDMHTRALIYRCKYNKAETGVRRSKNSRAKQFNHARRILTLYSTVIVFAFRRSL